MTVKTYIHSARKRAEATALLDSGATENFMNLSYAKWLGLPIKNLATPRPVYNVDGTANRTGDLAHYTDLKVRTGSNHTNMRFFLTDLGNHQVIFGYPWFAANQPRIDWRKGWIDEHQLPIVIKADNAHKATFTSRHAPKVKKREEQRIFVAKVQIGHPLPLSEPNTLPEEYR